MRIAALARTGAAMALVSLTSGCFLIFPVPLGQTTGKPVLTAPKTPDTCGAAGLQGLVGQREAALEAMRFKAPPRVIHPGQPVTMDYSAERLNIVIDGKGRIVSLQCG